MFINKCIFDNTRGLFTKTKLEHTRLTEIHNLLEICQQKLNGLEEAREQAVVQGLRTKCGITNSDQSRYRNGQASAFSGLKTSLEAELKKINDEIAAFQEYARKYI